MSSEDDSYIAATPSRGAEISLIEAFSIRGLYGYRTISLFSDHAATILIAKNGTGKTTLLGALDAFLRRQFFRLRGLDFHEITCKFRGEEELILRREDIEQMLESSDEGELVKLSRRIEVSPQALFRFVTEEWPVLKDSPRQYMDNTTFNAIMRVSNYTQNGAIKAIETVKSDLYSKTPNMDHVHQVIQRVLDGYDVVYLPTYRRVELALGGAEKEVHGRRRRPRFDVAAGSLYTGDIQFGLSDISDRLSDLNQKIVLESNSEYRQISANIINELIDGSFERQSDLFREIPPREDLELFFLRLEQGRRNAPFYPISLPNLDKIYSDDGVPEESGRFLNYFLSQLETVIAQTRDTERSVQEFVNKCNKYLLSEELTTRISGDAYVYSGDGKRLVLNRRNLRVHVESAPDGRKVSLDALSSGEKQMISLFAKLFLYEGKKIVLIDEPELSLSIDWQRDILVDVINAPLCRQIIAITHSPFVFDNELEPFARALKLETLVGPLPEESIEDPDE